jgi:hypothetical protein
MSPCSKYHLGFWLKAKIDAVLCIITSILQLILSETCWILPLPREFMCRWCVEHNVQLCEDSYRLMLDAFTVTKEAEPSFLSLLLFVDMSGQSCEESGGPTNAETCNVRLMWWHFVHYHSLRISAVPIITIVLMWCCTQGSAQGSREVLPTSKTPTSSARVTSMFLHSVNCTETVKRPCAEVCVVWCLKFIVRIIFS